MSMSKIASSLTLSATAYIVKTFRTLGLREFKVEGREILLDALKEVDRGVGRGSVVGASGSASRGATGLEGKGKSKAIDGVYPVTSEDRDDMIRNGVVLPGAKPKGRRGIVTVCNHNSVFDDPLMWSFIPTTSFLPFASPTHTSRNSRWTLGASDIMFTNPVLANFFASGQVIETIRGGGVFQPAIDRAVKLLQEGEWIHIFPEGKVNQHKMNPPGGLFRFKWGIGRIIMDSEVMPEIIPMWLSGFDQVMDEYRGFPRAIPRPGGRVSVTFGEPITAQVAPLVQRWRDLVAGEKGDLGVGGEWRGNGSGAGVGESESERDSDGVSTSENPSSEDSRQRRVRGSGLLAGGREEAMRMEITAVLQEELRRLGERIEREEGRFDEGKGGWSHSRRIA